MRGMSLEEINQVRNDPGRAVLLFITERCPVGCAHCSVDSRADSPAIEDFELFSQLIDGLAQRANLELVGISGGEPFVEKRGLQLAIDAFTKAGKKTVVYTSGVWAKGKTRVPHWICRTLEQIDTVFLSSDTFHEASVTDLDLVRAVNAITDSGAGLIVQTLDQPDMVDQAKAILKRALGHDWSSFCDLSLVPPLPYGRAEGIFQIQTRHPTHHFGQCSSLASPVVRFDGVVTACCNEAVIMGKGASRLRSKATTAHELSAVIDANYGDTLLTGIQRAGIGRMAEHPMFSDIRKERYPSACELCWKLQNQTQPVGQSSDPLLAAIAHL